MIMANNLKLFKMVEDWQRTELQRVNMLPLKCPYCLADFPADAVRCPSCSKIIGNTLPAVFIILRIGVVLLIIVAIIWLIIHFTHSH